MIDKALEFSGWDLLDPKQIVFELHTGSGRADYLLKDKLGRVLCVLEASVRIWTHTMPRSRRADTRRI